ncbi:MAG: D-alanyl-D-alanine endopeptidase [Nitrosomonadales bacterium]|nr:D-alanyl-D-alanine endopeptidase [Nitrosomonadales bacterium]
MLLLLAGCASMAPIAEARQHKNADDELTRLVLKKTSSPKLRSNIALIYDEKDQNSLYSKNADAIVPIASITKLMTAMVVLDAKLPLDEKITITEQDIDKLKGTHSRMRPGMSLTRAEMLKLALMSSENRAASALARTYPGGTPAAVAKMNEKARELGMGNTRFLDSSGLNSSNVSTAQDLVKMVSAARHYSEIHQYTTSTQHLASPQGYRPLQYINSNPLVRNGSWEIGVSKTGFINEAGRCLVMEAKISQRPVIIVLLDSQGKQTRVGDANRIKRWMESALPRNRNTRNS